MLQQLALPQEVPTKSTYCHCHRHRYRYRDPGASDPKSDRADGGSGSGLTESIILNDQVLIIILNSGFPRRGEPWIS